MEPAEFSTESQMIDFLLQKPVETWLEGPLPISKVLKLLLFSTSRINDEPSLQDKVVIFLKKGPFENSSEIEKIRTRYKLVLQLAVSQHWKSSSGEVLTLSDTSKDCSTNDNVEVKLKTGDTIYKAAEEGDWEKVIECFKAGADPNRLGENGYTPLQEALEAEKFDAAEKIIEAVQGKFDVNKTSSSSNMTALFLASKYGQRGLVEKLLALSADPNISTDDEVPPVAIAVAEGHPEIALLLLRRGAIVSEEMKNILFLMSAEKGYLDLLKIFLDRGAELEFSKDEEKTALHLAAGNGRVDIVKELLARGAKVDAQDENENTSLFAALHAEENSEEIVKVLLQGGADANAINSQKEVPLFQAVEKGLAAVIRLLVDHGAKLNYDGENGAKLMYRAAYNHGDTPEVASALFYAGFDISSCKDMMEELFVQAASRGYLGLVQLFLEKGISVNAFHIQTALHSSASSRFKEVVDYLLGREADCSIVDSNGFTPLHAAIHGGELDIFQGIFAHLKGKTFDSANNKMRFTPLHVAAEYGRVEMMRILLAEKANPNAYSEDYFQETPLHTAARGGKLDAVKLLLQSGADPSIKNKDRKLPIDLVKEVDRANFAALLTPNSS